MDKGYTQFPNEIFDAILSCGLSRTQLIVLLYIIRKTNGWNKPEDQISISRMARDIGRGKSRRWVSGAVNDLEKMGIIVSHGGNGKAKYFSIRPTGEWDEPVSNMTQVPESKLTQVGCVETDTGGESELTQVPESKLTQVPVSKLTHTKDNINTIKNNNTKDKDPDPFFEDDEEGLEGDALMEAARRYKEQNGLL